MVKNYRVDFETIKARADFRAVLTHYGIALLGQGEQAKVRCPFHDDERPSCSVNLERRIFHCHAGSCGVSGNVLEFVHRMETKDGEIVSLKEAAVKLAGICSIELDQGSGRGKPNEGRRAPSGRGKVLAKADRGNGAQRGSDRPQSASADATAPNKPLGFQLRLDADHPYVQARVPSSLITPSGVRLRDVFGVGLCQKGSMAGRGCVPIHTWSRSTSPAGARSGRADRSCRSSPPAGRASPAAIPLGWAGRNLPGPPPSPPTLP